MQSKFQLISNSSPLLVIRNWKLFFLTDSLSLSDLFKEESTNKFISILHHHTVYMSSVIIYYQVKFAKLQCYA